jgi:hypothetical protein
MAVLRWLFEDYIFIQIRSAFYVTETATTNNKTFFYLKDDWRTIANECFLKYREKHWDLYNLEKTTLANAIALCKKRMSSGVHMGRLLPKNFNNELRVIR